MPSFTKTRRKKKVDIKTDSVDMASSGRYRRVDQELSSGSFVRNVTTQRKSEQAKSIRSHSVPSLNSREISKQPSPSRQPRSNSVRMSSSIKKFSIRRRIAKMFGSHSDLSGKGGTAITDHQSSGVYRPIGTYRTRSIGGSSDCSSSSLTSAPAQQSEFSRHNSLRESSHSRVSQNSVFSSRQPSCDSADAINFSVHGPMVPTESGLRPKSIACMQRSSSNSSLKNNALHMTDPRYYSLAALSSNRVDTHHDFFVHSMDERILNSTRAGGLPRIMRPAPPQEEPELEESGRVKPSDPEYRKVAENLMSCSPQPIEEVGYAQQQQRMFELEQTRKVSTEAMKGGHIPPSISSPMVASIHSSRFSGKRCLTPDAGSVSLALPYEWEVALTASGLKYYINHQSQSTHWNMPNDSNNLSSEDESDLPIGWELVKSKKYGNYYVNHNNFTAQYQHPVHAGAPPPYHLAILYGEDDERDRRLHVPVRSHSHRSSQAHRIYDPNASLPRRSKSFRDAPTDSIQLDSNVNSDDVIHTRQLSTMTYVPPSPFQIAEIPLWLKEYVDAPFGSEKDKQIQWSRYPEEHLSGLDTMTKRLLKKSSEQLVKKFEYYKVALQQELEQRQHAKRFDSAHRNEVHLPPLPTAHHHTPPQYRHPLNGVFPRGPRPLYPSIGPAAYHPPTSTYYMSHRVRPPPPSLLPSSSASVSNSSHLPHHVTSSSSSSQSNDLYSGLEETFV